MFSVWLVAKSSQRLWLCIHLDAWQELEDPMLSIGIVTDPVEIKDIVEKLDKDANGLIDFHEFVDFLTPHAKHNNTSLEKHEAMFMQLTKKMEVRVVLWVPVFVYIDR